MCLKFSRGQHDVFIVMEKRLMGGAAQEEWNEWRRKGIKVAAGDDKVTTEGEEVGWKTLLE